jgi:hypothetical protein
MESNGHGDKLRLREAFLAQLLAQPTIKQACQAIGISQGTATRWLRQPAFKQAYAEARWESLAEALHYLQGSILRAVAVLNAVLLDPDAKPAVKVIAARAVLEFGLRSIEQEQIADRLSRIEEALAIGGGNV